jgi:hypothetical protein
MLEKAMRLQENKDNPGSVEIRSIEGRCGGSRGCLSGGFHRVSGWRADYGHRGSQCVESACHHALSAYP